MEKGQRIGVRVEASAPTFTEEQQASDARRVGEAVDLLSDADATASGQNGELTGEQKTELVKKIDHLRAQMHQPSDLDSVVDEPLYMLGVK